MKLKALLIKNYLFLKEIREKIFNSLFGNRDYQKFVIISDSRTGSTLLMDYLNSHPQILALGEEFRDLNGKSCREIWSKTFCNRRGLKCVGFKLFYHHPRNRIDQNVWKFIEEDKNVVIIHLTRKNILRSYISKQIGLKTKKWTEHIQSTESFKIEEKKITIDIEGCIQNLEDIEQMIKKTNEKFRSHKVIPIEYEQMVGNREKELNKIFEIMKLEHHTPKSVLRKHNPEALPDLVSNYKELELFLANKGKAHYLDEDLV